MAQKRNTIREAALLLGACLLVSLLRHPDPVVPELARQALLYLESAASQSSYNGEDDTAAVR